VAYFLDHPVCTVLSLQGLHKTKNASGLPTGPTHPLDYPPIPPTRLLSTLCYAFWVVFGIHAQQV